MKMSVTDKESLSNLIVTYMKQSIYSKRKEVTWLIVLCLCFIPMSHCDPEVTPNVLPSYEDSTAPTPIQFLNFYGLGDTRLSGSQNFWDTIYANTLSNFRETRRKKALSYITRYYPSSKPPREGGRPRRYNSRGGVRNFLSQWMPSERLSRPRAFRLRWG